MGEIGGEWGCVVSGEGPECAGGGSQTLFFLLDAINH